MYPTAWAWASQDPKQEAVIAALERFYTALETGEYIAPLAGHSFTLKPAWATPEGRERLISAIDAEFLRELTANVSHWTGAGITKHPSFYRLSESMRLAFAQQLELTLIGPYEAKPPAIFAPPLADYEE